MSKVGIRIPLLNTNKEKKDKGQYFTPKPMVREILKRVINYFSLKKVPGTIRILDPALGKGIFLNVMISLITPLVHSVEFYGLDIDSSVIEIAERDLIPLVEKKNFKMSLKNGNFFFDCPFENKKDFDIIIGNPPHNARFSSLEWKKIRKSCKYGQNPRIRSESSIFFTFKSLNMLKVSGILCFILPKPIIYSKRWNEFRKILLTKYTLIEVFDLGNQFSGQLQEQCMLIVKKQLPNFKHQTYETGIWNQTELEFEHMNTITNFNALMFDNFLVGVSESDLDIISRLYNDEYEFLDVIAFRGLSSKFRSKMGKIPLIEKNIVNNGFLFPSRNFVRNNTPQQLIVRQKVPKIVAQRIISYRTKPQHLLDIRTWVDRKGLVITHETVINIIPNYPREVISLDAIAGLLKSSFIEWWLRHVVYTKRFVTSKDFDKAYICSIRIPKVNNLKNINYRKKMGQLLQKDQYGKIMKEVKSQSIIDKLHTLGEFFCKYQSTGEEIKLKISKMILDERIKALTKNKPKYKKYRWLYGQITRKKEKFPISFNTSKYDQKVSKGIDTIRRKFIELQIIQKYINEIVFSLYDLNLEEQKVIKGEIA